MGEKLFLAGRFTDLSKPDQLGRLNDLLVQILAIVNVFDPNSFALAWIEGATAGQVIASKGANVAPEWDPSPALTGATFSGLTASQLVATNASKALVSVAPASAYTPTNVSEDRAFNADSTSTAELADVLGTLIADLQSKGILA
jgi:hypothetical protein